MLMDARMEFVQEAASKALAKLLGESDGESDARLFEEMSYVLGRTHALVVESLDCASSSPSSPLSSPSSTSSSSSSASSSSSSSSHSPSRVANCESSVVVVDEKMLVQCVRYWEQLLDKPVGCRALEHVFSERRKDEEEDVGGRRSLVTVLLAIASPLALTTCQNLGARIVRFFNKLFKIAEKGLGTEDKPLDKLCKTLSSQLALVDASQLRDWLKLLVLGTSDSFQQVGQLDVEQDDKEQLNNEQVCTRCARLFRWLYHPRHV